MYRVVRLFLLNIIILFSIAFLQNGFADTGVNGDSAIRQSVGFERSEFAFGGMRGYDIVTYKGEYACGYVSESGAPMLPRIEIRVALPEGMAAKEVAVMDKEVIELDGRYNIYPAQPPARITDAAKDRAFIEPNGDIYGSSTLYPGQVLEMVRQSDLAGQSFVIIEIAPLQYNPVERKVTLITDITFEITGTDGYRCGDYLPANISDAGRASYRRMLENMVVNPQDIVMVERASVSEGVGPGSYDYVIVTSTAWEDDFEPLARWKTKKGVEAAVVTTDWIYNSGGYSGDDAARIRAFVMDAHGTWGATYFLLGGDTDNIPYHSDNIGGDNIPNDTYYGDYDHDWTCEVNVGRASVRSASAIDNFIDKVLTYEQDPPSSYPKKIALLGFDLDRGTPGEECKDYINSNYIPSGWTVTQVYDSHSGNHKKDATDAVNSGQNLINHIDHCDEDVIGLGYTNHSYYWSKIDVDAFSNGDRQSIFYSIGCGANAYDYSDCIAEHFVRDDNGGGIGFVGNSRSGWYNPGNTSTLSMLYDRYFFRSLFDQGHYNLGECFSDHKNDGPTGSTYEQYVFTELTLLGDPELPVWTDDPSNLTVTHPSSLPQGQSSFAVNVRSGGYNVSEALVCLWKDGDVFETGTTNSSGNVTLYPSPSSTGTMYVTATKHNYLPYQGSATVTGGGGPSVSIDMIPDNYPIYVGRGGSFGYTGELENNMSYGQTVDVWLMLELPSGYIYGPLQRYNNIYLSGYRNIQVHVNQDIPYIAPLGVYNYLAYCGDYPGYIMDSAYFDFTVTGVAGYEGGGSAWTLDGWFDGNTGIPEEMALHSNYPNPFNATTTISLDLPSAGDVNLEVYNLMGQRIATLIDEKMDAGRHSVTWDASAAASGVYFYKLTTGGKTFTKKMVLLK